MKQSISSQDSKQKNKISEDNMNIYWSALKDEDHSNSFYKTSVWLKNNSALSKPKTKMGIMKQYILTHKVKFSLIIFTALLLAACNMPVTQNESIGHILSWTVENPETVDKVSSLPWVDKNNLSVNVKESDNNEVTSYNLVLANSSLEDVQMYSKDLESIPGIIEVRITPLTEEVERPLYSKMLDDVFKIDINARNMSDEELSAEVERQLKEGGIDVETINFKRDENNRRLIDIKMSEDGNKKGFQLNINDGYQKMRIEEKYKKGNLPMEDFDIKGKNDNEIRQMVKERFKDKNLQDSDINISREGDKVTVDIDKSSSNGNENIQDNIKMKMKLETK